MFFPLPPVGRGHVLVTRILFTLLATAAVSCSLPAPGGADSARSGTLQTGSPSDVDAGNDVPRSAEQPLQVAFLIVDGVYNSELMAPFDIFHHSVFHTQPGMQVFTVGPDSSPVTSFEGLRILPDYGYDEAPGADVLVVPSAEHSMDSDLEDAALMAYVRRAGAEARVVVSLCDGAFVLAAAGLLDGLECTTFPSDVERMRTMFPQLTIHEQVSFVHDGNAITSAGGALSYDAALYLAEQLYGPSPARGMAAGLCIDWKLDQVAHIRTADARP